MYRPEIDVEALTAVDVHVHVEVGDHGHCSLPPDLAAAAARYFRTDGITPDLASIAQFYRERRMAAVVFTVDAEHQLGHPPIPSEQVVDQAADHADVLIPFGSVDPHRPDAVDRVRSLALEHGARGFKLHPTVQGFDPSDPRYRPFWAALAELRLPVVVHTGQTGIGAGVRGGHGFKLRYSDPMLLDDVAAEFPDLSLIFAHPSVPWQDQAISIATHKANVAIDLSGWRPKYFPPALVRAADTFLRERVLFGSDFPLIHPDVWMKDFADLPIRPEVRPLILRENALRILGLAPQIPTHTEEDA
ncbi:amidohydrolase family protein [Kineococcus sp. LSe6-4]|uniref:Amidohydrolase family protein n=1 Tax=Kineococcus halophytocola TaxID=3234027 RepID=A0ABV4H4G5_9ACTN